MSSVESTPFNVGLKTQNMKMHFCCYNYDVAYNFKEKKNKTRGNAIHTFHILIKQKIQASYTINWIL